MTVPSRFVADLDELRRVVQQLTRGDGDLRELVGDLDRSVDALHLTWSGAAAEAHRSAHRAWADGFREMRAGLEVMRRAADTARDNYETAATTNARMWGHLS